MQINISFLPALAAAFLLTFARIGTMMMMMPGLGESNMPSRVRLTIALVLTGTLAGLPLPVTVHARIGTTARSVTVTPTDVDVLGQVFRVASLSASPRTAPLAAKLAPHTVTVPELPSGVRITGARAGADGLRLTASISPGTASQHTNGCAAHRT